jgi:hypothetical protein
MGIVDRSLVRFVLAALVLMALLDAAIRSALDPTKALQIVLGAGLAVIFGAIVWSVHHAESHEERATEPDQD